MKTMGKTASSCFKTINCGSGSVDHDDIQASEGLSDKRVWSFRKRSARHRVLSNTVVSEAPSAVIKEDPESNVLECQAHPSLTLSEKTSGIQWIDEKAELSTQVKDVSETTAAREDSTKSDVIIDEFGVIIIQAAIRGFLARIELLKHKNVMKLQAVIRGHLVRRHAAGSLRCVQAIVKMQALVRARQGFQHVRGSRALEKRNESQSKKKKIPDVPHTYISIEKLLSNRFARQLLESTPRTKPISINCDPSRPDSAWRWLERWTAVSPIGNEKPQEAGLAVELHNKENLWDSDEEDNTSVPSSYLSASTNVASSMGALAGVSKNDHNLITSDADNLDLRAYQPTSPPLNHRLEKPQLQEIHEPSSGPNILDGNPIQKKDLDLLLEVERRYVFVNDTEVTEDLPHSKCFTSEQPESQTDELSFGSPTFAGAQSKFKDFGSAGSNTNLTSSNQDTEAEPLVGKFSSVTNQSLGSAETDLAEDYIARPSLLQIASECRTELSISSNLNSQHWSDTDVAGTEQVQKTSGGTNLPESNGNSGVETNGKSRVSVPDKSYTTSDQLERYNILQSVNSESVNSAVATGSPQGKPDIDSIDVKQELGSETTQPAYKSSPEASPRSHITLPESQATPATQFSMKPKRTKGEKSKTDMKRKSLSADKQFSSSHKQDYSVRSSLEQLPKEHKTGKRRNSLGSAKSDHVNQESRDSNCSSALPSYMQATESARAKAIANSSPRSSPDVHDKDIIKKRDSLPSAKERQGSPHIRRSLSQTPLNVKGNGTHSPQDRKWRR